MPTQQQIHDFTQAFHVAAIERLLQRPELIAQALQTLDRWHAQRGPSAADPYMHEWRDLLKGDLGQLKSRVCANDEHAQTLRSTSPLGFAMTPAERMAIRAQAMGLPR